MQVRYILLSAPRTGSTYLQNRICLLPRSLCFRALFSLKGWPVPEDWDAPFFKDLDPSWADAERRLSEPVRLLEEISRVLSSYAAIGVKHHVTSQEKHVTEKILDHTSKIVLLTRDNLLASYSSELLVRATGQGAARVGGEPIKTAKVSFDEAHFELYCMRRKRSYQRTFDLITECDVLSIEYASLCHAEKDELERLCRFLGIGYADGSSIVLRRHSPDILSRFENREEVSRYLDRIGKSAWISEIPGGT